MMEMVYVGLKVALFQIHYIDHCLFTVGATPWGLEILMFIVKPQRRQWHPTPVLLPGKPHGGRSLVGYSPWGRRVSHN